MNTTEINKKSLNQETEDVHFGCETSWASIVDRYVFDDNEEEIINKAVEKIEARFISRGEDFNDSLEQEVRLHYGNLLVSPVFNQSTIKQIKTDSHQMKKEFISSCVKHSLELLSKRKNSLNR